MAGKHVKFSLTLERSGAIREEKLREMKYHKYNTAKDNIHIRLDFAKA